MKQRIIDIIAGTRPNFMKVFALWVHRDNFPDLQLRLVHTGQHYDPLMSDIFFQEFGLTKPACHLKVGSDTHARQTAAIMMRYEKWIQSHRPDVCLVVGDVNSTAACAIVSAKAGIPVVHVEAGLRSFDRSMPEEINRMLTDSVCDLCFVTEPSGVNNLKNEGHDDGSIHLVGNVMIDTLYRMKPQAEALNKGAQFGLEPKQYAYLTLHRPSNVDDDGMLNQILEQLIWLSERMPVIFPAHPRTKKCLQRAKRYKKIAGMPKIFLIEPLGYLDSLSVMLQAKVVITDSGGMQEETSALNIPCLTLRANTERPITIEQGTNTLIKNDWALFQDCVKRICEGTYPLGKGPIPYWDGNAGMRILEICSTELRG